MVAERVLALEADANGAWPAREVVTGAGWEARWSGGAHRRINSATILAGADIATAIDAIVAFYRDRGAPPIVKVTAAAAHPGIDDLLQNRGWQHDTLTQVRTATTAEVAPDPRVDLDLDRSTWLAAFAAASGRDDSHLRGLEQILDRIPEPWPAAIRIDGEITAVGLGVPLAERLGIFDVATRPQDRGRGLAAGIVRSLMARAADRGIPEAFLQVGDTNRSAVHLYARIGFTEEYRYWYRLGPSGTGPR